jgi:hypothetical protein
MPSPALARRRSFARRNGYGPSVNAVGGDGADMPVQHYVIENQQQADLLTNALRSRSELLSKWIDGPLRDLDAECGYPPEIRPEDYRAMFEREGIAARVVKLEPDETWRSPPEVYDDEDPENTTDFEQGWQNLVAYPNLVLDYLKRWDTLSRLGRYAVLIVGVDDPAPTLEQPLPHRKRNEDGSWEESPIKRRLLYLRPVSETNATFTRADLVSDKNNPRYGLPEFYHCNLGDPEEAGIGVIGAEARTTTTTKVHWTRVLHLPADGALESDMYGPPAMRDVYNRLMDMRKTLGGSAEMFWKGGFPGVSFEVNPNLMDAAVKTEDLKQAIEDYTNKLKRYIALTGVSAKSLAVQVADPTPHMEVQYEAVAVAKDMPVRILKGSERGELASSQDQMRWNGRIMGRQLGHVTNRILLPFVYRLIEVGVLPPPAQTEDNPNGDVLVAWKDLNEPTPKEKAERAKLITEAMVQYISGKGKYLCGEAEWWTLIQGFSPEEAEQMLENAMDLLEREEMEMEAAQAATEATQAKAEATLNPPERPQPPGARDEGP